MAESLQLLVCRVHRVPEVVERLVVCDIVCRHYLLVLDLRYSVLLVTDALDFGTGVSHRIGSESKRHRLF